MIEVMFKLISVYYLYITSSDKLIIIAILYTIIPFLINIVYKNTVTHTLRHLNFTFLEQNII